MCGRIVWIWDPKTGQLLRKLVDDPEADEKVNHVLHKRRYNVPPASHLPVIRGNRMVVARWGFPIPQRPNGVFNTRIETAAESPMWRSLIGASHCLFPVHGFYEWRRDGRNRSRPHFVYRADGEPMLLGGLIEERTWQGDRKTCASILTCEPTAMMAELHDRMPVVIGPDDAHDWLAAERTFELAVPFDGLSMHEVTPDVGDTKNDEPQLMAPIETTGLGAFT